MIKEDKEAELLWGALEYARKIEQVEPELAQKIREKAWKEFREKVKEPRHSSSRSPGALPLVHQ
jgi:DNA-directed RNA polymerase subunit F